MSKAHRCDRCGAESFGLALIQHGTGEERRATRLYFCGHHFAEHEAALYGVAEDVTDERHLINARPSQSATV